MTLPQPIDDREYEKFVSDSDGNVAVRTLDVGGINIPSYDETVLGYTGDNLTSVTYKLATVTVATLTLSYTDGKLTSVVKS